MACPSCGSWSVKSDRSLAGRYVCGRCGRPLGLQAERRIRRGRVPGGRSRRRGWCLVLGLLAIGAGLSALEFSRRPPRGLPPVPAPPSPPQSPFQAAPPGRSL
ncbi:hypothetical protein [Cyanobium sp. NIES-981]|uniref:hypothetical protein n=1 Tax=Cyanobium sp. NIES-981 TaxID=1851505 RepID=UPI0007DD9D2F|nr:hypothetical protein [Cyanobium sp. NIES-981]SBO42226.1 conserved protein of unknown function [Cyanobium sp. NIES-981]